MVIDTITGLPQNYLLELEAVLDTQLTKPTVTTTKPKVTVRTIGFKSMHQGWYRPQDAEISKREW